VPFPTLVATAGAENANAYATQADADAWLEFRIGAGAWDGYSDELKAQALASATRDLDTLDFWGRRATESQALEWPRDVSGTPIADLYDTDDLPADLVAATIELAFLYAQAVTANATLDPLNPSTNGNLKRKKIGPIEKEWFGPTVVAIDVARFSALIQALLAGLLRVAVANRYGTGTAYRSS
jgi:hypothetical protein